MYQPGDTIRKTLDEIERHDLVLPAIQREFVWKSEQICRLFDSIMQGYPFGTFLYWKVQPENSTKFKFYDFVLKYHERDNPHCPPLSPMPTRQMTAVLDGQQRLTALNIGLRGTMAWKLPYKWWNSPDAFPTRRLYLDLLWHPAEDDEEEIKYRFDFLTESQTCDESDGKCWFPVGNILFMEGGPAMVRWLNQQLPQEQVDQAYGTLDRLYRVVHTEKMVSFYEEGSQELEKVLQIFIRTNSGGTFLSYSDLLLSVAVAQWKHHDAREEIHAVVSELNRIGIGFSFSKDLVLKAGLMLSDIGSVGFKVDNFNRENMAKLEKKWNSIKQALSLTVRLVSNFGFNGQTLRADSAILPIAYYLYIRDPGESYLTKNKFKEDRQEICKWLIRSLLKASGIWGSGLDTLLTALRQIIKENGNADFPVIRIREEMARRGKSLVFEKEELEELADMQYGNKLTFALLSLIFPFIDLSNHFHVDHIFPATRFTDRQLRDAGVPDDKVEDFKQLKNGLANLQLLQGAENNEKRAKLPAEWLAQSQPYPEGKQEYENLHLLGKVPEEITAFDVFYTNRRARLLSKIARLLGG